MVKYKQARRKYGRRKNKAKARVPMATRKYVKAVIHKTEETKRWGSTPITNNLLNTGVLFAAPLQAITQGVGSFQRVGKKIHVNNVQWKGLYTGPQNLYESYLRLIVFEADPETVKFGQVGTPPVMNHDWQNDSQVDWRMERKLFFNPGGANFYSAIDYTKVRVISDKLIRQHKDVLQNVQAPTTPIYMNVRLNRTITYESDASYSIPLGKQLYFALVMHTIGVAPGTNAGTLQGQFLVTYKDA